MSEQILNELKELRFTLTKIVGTSDKPATEQFSITALNAAAEQYKNICIERGEWISDDEIGKWIKSAPYGAGSFIREHFKFTNYFKRGRTHYYNKKHLTDLGRELEDRNIDLSRYIEYLKDLDKFREHVESVATKNKGKKTKGYEIPTGIRDITTSPPRPPDLDLIKTDIKQLKREYHLQGYLEYIDIYRDRHAMLKHLYYFDKYLQPGLKSKLTRWCKDFNYAHEAIRKAKELIKENAHRDSD